MSLSVSDFLQVNISWYNLKTVPAVPTVFSIFRIQEKPAKRSFFISQNMSKPTNVFKNRVHSFLSYTKY